MKTKLTALAASTALLCSLTSCGSSLVGKTDFNEITTSATITAVTSTTETTTTDTTISQTSHGKGSIFDSKGHLLVSDSDDGKKRVFANDYSVSFANIITPMSDGFDANFDKILTAPDKNGGCQSIMLTIDGDVQNDIYSYMESIDLIGSVVVLRSDGSIMAEVNYPSYDPNAVADQIYNEDLAWGDTGNKAFSILCEESSGDVRKSKFILKRGLAAACSIRLSSNVLSSIITVFRITRLYMLALFLMNH